MGRNVACDGALNVRRRDHVTRRGLFADVDNCVKNWGGDLGKPSGVVSWFIRANVP